MGKMTWLTLGHRIKQQYGDMNRSQQHYKNSETGGGRAAEGSDWHRFAIRGHGLQFTNLRTAL